MKERIEINLFGVSEGDIKSLKEYLSRNCWNWTTRHLEERPLEEDENDV